MYDTRVLVRGNLLLPDLPAVVVTAWLRHEDLDNLVAAPMMNNDFSPRTHSDSEVVADTRRWGVLALPSTAVGVCVKEFLSCGIEFEVEVIYGLDCD